MYLSVNKTYAQFNSELAKNEKNDCVVRSIASATETTYNIAHKFCKDVFGREDKKGTNNLYITTELLKAEKDGIELGGKKFGVRVLGSSEITNSYKLYGEIIKRKKTLKSFIESHEKGTYLVMISKHALTVKDGEVFDWSSNKYKPTTKVMAAYEIIGDVEKNDIQLSLFN